MRSNFRATLERNDTDGQSDRCTKLQHVAASALVIGAPKRFNVAITRACSLMIIVGNPAVLTKDPHWGRLLRMCIERGAYTGVQPPPPIGGGEGNNGSDGDGNDGSDGDGNELLADRLEDIMAHEVDASQLLQQEGNEMPSWGQN